MQLPRTGAEDIHLTIVADAPEGAPVYASIDGRATWFLVPDRDAPNNPVFLAVGPDNTTATGGQRITNTVTAVWVRMLSDPETVDRLAGTIFLI